MSFAEALASYRSPRVPIAEADLSAIDPAWHEQALKVYGWPDGTIEQDGLDGFARIHPANAGREMDVLAEATATRLAAIASLAEAEQAWREELRRAYANGATAVSLAEVVGLSAVRVQQLVAGARRR